MADETFTKEQLDAAISAAVSSEVTGLKNKNEELLGKLAKTKGIDPTEVERLKEVEKQYRTMQTKAEEEQGEFKKLYGTAKTELEQTKSSYEQKLADADSTIKSMTKKMDINKALSAHKIIPKMHDIAVNTILPNVALDDNGEAMVGSKKVSEFVDGWIKGDVGKHFVMNDTTGGGADGHDSSSSAEQAGWFKEGSSTWNLTKQGQLRKEDPVLADRLAKAGKKS